jgi:GNAT superfamily N-acetyltransferase
MMTLSTQIALEVFLRGFSTTRSFIKPYEATPVGAGVWMLADPPGGKPPVRTPEFICSGTEPDSVVEAIRQRQVARHYLCILIENEDDLNDVKNDYKSRGYRYRGREPLFVLPLAERKQFSAWPVRRIVTEDDAAAVAKAAGSRQIHPQHLSEEDSVCRLYAAYDGETPIGWVRSIRTHPECAWVSTMYVEPAHRRKGIGRTLLSAMLDDDERFGVRWSVLLASLAGALLYPHLGYVQQGLLLVFTPTRPR